MEIEKWTGEVNREAEKAAGQGRSEKQQREVFDTSAAAGSASHAILRGFSSTSPVVPEPQTQNTNTHKHYIHSHGDVQRLQEFTGTNKDVSHQQHHAELCTGYEDVR